MAKIKDNKLPPAKEPLIISYEENGQNIVKQWKDPSYFVAWGIKVARTLDTSDIDTLEKVKKIFTDTCSIQALFQDEHLLGYSKEYPNVYMLWKFCYDAGFR